MEKLLLKNANIIDGRRNSGLQTGMDLYIEDGVIRQIGKNLCVSGAKEIELNGAYVMPGLINLHVHLPASGKLSKTAVADKSKLVNFMTKTALTRAIGVEMGASYASMELRSGVTTLRAVGGVHNFDSVLRDKINSGKKIGPRILAADYAIGVNGGHMDGTVAKGAETVEQAVEMVRSQAAKGVDLIKLMITGGILDTEERGKIGLLRMPPEMVKACCDEAHKLGLKVAAHIEGPEGVKVGILGGVDTIEHGAPVPDALIALLKESGRAYVATFSPAIPLCVVDPGVLGYSEDVQYNSRVLLAGMQEFTDKCLAAGIPVGLGTDTGCPLVTHYDMWRELFYFTKYARNVDNGFAIHTATLVNAQIAGVDEVTGSVEVGKCADLLITSGNPLDDLTALKEPKLVICKGRPITAKNKKYPAVDAILDQVFAQLQ